MFAPEPVTGTDLPDGVLVLTYDDGPGPNTLAVAEYLSEMGIEATFFVVGLSVEKLPNVPARVRALGQRLGAHTWTHYRPGLPAQLQAGGDIVGEMARTAALFDAEAEPLAFRPPYGAWDHEVAATLKADARLDARHVGPFNWEIHCPDWQAWLDGVDPTTVANCFRKEARVKRKGIVLLHDYTAEVHNQTDPKYRIMAERNRCVELTRALVPVLLADGFQFAPLSTVKSPFSPWSL